MPQGVSYTLCMLAMRPLVLLSNDDGYLAPGIRAFRDALATWAEVITVAPATEQSAASHAISLHRSLRILDTEPGVYAIDGTPADCVYVAFSAGIRILPRLPDMVCSGVNAGLNLGQDTFYSGTVAAAREGALRGLPALAASMDTSGDFVAAAGLASAIAQQLLEAKAGDAALLNLNVPAMWNGELRACRLGRRYYEDAVDIRRDPRGREYLWIGGTHVTHKDDPGSDTDAFDQGYSTLTTLSLDLSSRDDVLANAIAAGAFRP